MSIVNSSYAGIVFDFDLAANPFFQVSIEENLRAINGLNTGKALLDAIGKATPAHRPGNFPQNANVIIKPPLGREFLAPGLAKSFDHGLIVRDANKFADFQAGKGMMTATAAAKTQVQEESKTEAQGGGGSVCWLFFSNNEIRTQAGEWLPTYITMGHELIHCFNALTGATDKVYKNEEYATVGIKGFAAKFTENQLRQEAGFKLRTKYFSDD